MIGAEVATSKNSNTGQCAKSLRSKLVPDDWVTAEIDQDGVEVVLKPVLEIFEAPMNAVGTRYQLSRYVQKFDLVEFWILTDQASRCIMALAA